MEMSINGWDLTSEELDQLGVAIGIYQLELIVPPGAAINKDGLSREECNKRFDVVSRIFYKMNHYRPV